MTAYLHWLFTEMVAIQREIYLVFGDRIKVYAETGDWSQLVVFLPMGIVIGAVHALTPGHSKTLLAAYSVAAPTSTKHAIGTAFLLSGVHIFMSVLIVLLSLPLVSMALGNAGTAPALEILSRVLVGAIGVWMILTVFREKYTRHKDKRSAAFAIFAGLIPCPLTLFVMTFAASRSVTEAGLAFAVVMLIGVAIVLGIVAVIANSSGKKLSSFFKRQEVMAQYAAKFLQAVTGAILIIAAWQVVRF